MNRRNNSGYNSTQKEQIISKWRNVLAVTILSIILVAAGNAVVALVNGNLQREVERSKAESNRTLEMIKTGDTGKANGNIELLLMQNNDPIEMNLEQAKWQAELELRKRELELKEREQDNRDAEIEIRRKEQAVSKWLNPLTVAVLAAAVAGAGNAVVAFVNGNLQREVERSKAESNRILEMIKTDDTEKAASNLEFLLESGLLTEPTLISKLSRFLKQRTPCSGQSLPSSNARVGFEQSDLLTKSLQENLQKLLDSYFIYLDQVGFPPAQRKVTVKVKSLPSPNAYYLDTDDTIVIDQKIADDPSVVLREYNHHILMLKDEQQKWRGNYAAIESGLADYFACSFLNNPHLGEKAVKVYNTNQKYIRSLSSNRTFDDDELRSSRDLGGYPHIAGEVWGGGRFGISVENWVVMSQTQ